MWANKFLLSSVLFLSACASSPQAPAPITRIEYKTVNVPVPVSCKTEEPTKPSTTFETLSESDDIFEQVKALLSDRLIYIGHIDQLTTAFKECKKAGDKQQ